MKIKSYYTKLKFYDVDKKAYFTLTLCPGEVSNSKFIRNLALSFGHFNYRPVKSRKQTREDFRRMMDILLSPNKNTPIVKYAGVSTRLPRRKTE